jgi:hypothetical protein
MFAEMPLDNRTVDPFEASPSRLASQAVLKRRRPRKRSNISWWLIVL